MFFISLVFDRNTDLVEKNKPVIIQLLEKN